MGIDSVKSEAADKANTDDEYYIWQNTDFGIRVFKMRDGPLLLARGFFYKEGGFSPPATVEGDPSPPVNPAPYLIRGIGSEIDGLSPCVSICVVASLVVSLFMRRLFHRVYEYSDIQRRSISTGYSLAKLIRSTYG